MPIEGLGTRTGLLVLQSTSFCNIDCSYCYLPDRHKKNVMALADLPLIFERLYGFPNFQGNITVLWHAGEPCVLPASYYESAIDIIEASRPKWVTFNYSMLSNGTLIDESWIPLFRRENFHLGISVDGPERFHDARRLTRSKQKTHHKVLNALRILNEASIPFYVISVLSPDALRFPEEFAIFYAENNVRSVGFNIDELEGFNSSTEFEATREDTSAYKRFLLKIVEHTSKLDNGLVNVRELHSAFARIKFAAAAHDGAEHSSDSDVVLNEQTSPFAIINIAHDGSISTFSPELLTSTHEDYGDFVFGNVLSDNYDDIIVNEKFQRVLKEISLGIEKCKADCGFYSVCGGGAPSNKLFENGSFNSSETVFCRFTQQAVLETCLEMYEQKSPMETIPA